MTQTRIQKEQKLRLSVEAHDAHQSKENPESYKSKAPNVRTHSL